MSVFHTWYKHWLEVLQLPFYVETCFFFYLFFFLSISLNKQNGQKAKHHNRIVWIFPLTASLVAQPGCHWTAVPHYKPPIFMYMTRSGQNIIHFSYKAVPRNSKEWSHEQNTSKGRLSPAHGLESPAGWTRPQQKLWDLGNPRDSFLPAVKSYSW